MGKILIIEDDSLITKVYSTRLLKDGHQVFTAGDGETGIKLALANKPDLIVLDLMLPKLSGIDVLTQLKGSALTAKIPVIVYSNLARNEEITKAKQLGATEFIAKSSLSPQQFVTKVESFLK